MAVFQFFPVPKGVVTKTTLTNASSAEIVLGKEQVFMIIADQDCFIKFGNSGMGAAAATDMYIPAKVSVIWDTGSHVDRVRVFAAGTSANIYIQAICRS